jgi:alpha-tubulin suppressor-like RCC1 family protein
VTTEGRTYCWGDNHYGQLGDSSTTRRTVPVPVASQHQFRQVDAGGGTTGGAFTCAVTIGHQAFCWGQGRYGQLGNGKTGRKLFPKAVAGGLSLKRVTTGWQHACAESTLNRAYCWGSNAYGQLGVGTFAGPEVCNGLSCSSTPTQVLGGLFFRQLSAGSVHVCGKASTAVLYCWGNGLNGNLGDGTTEFRTTPTPVADPS